MFKVTKRFTKGLLTGKTVTEFTRIKFTEGREYNECVGSGAYMVEKVEMYMPRELTLVGAYGREATLEDWTAGKDFLICGGPYCSIRDIKLMKADGYTDVTLLRRDGTVVVMINIDEAMASTYKEPSLS